MLNTIYLICAPIIVFIGVGTGILVWKQVNVMRSAERAQLDLDLVMNAYIVHTYDVQLSNHGRSIAIVTAYRFTHDSFPIAATDLKPEHALTHYEETWPMHAMLQANIPRKDWHTHDLRKTIGETSGALGDDRKIIISATVEYRDIFGKNHRTEVVYRYLPFSRELKPLWEYGEFS